MSIQYNIFIMTINKLTKSLKANNLTKNLMSWSQGVTSNTKRLFQCQIGNLTSFWDLHHFETHEIPSFIRYLAVPIILFSLATVEAEKMFSQLKIVKTKLFSQMSQDFLNVLISIRHGSNSFDKINRTAVDKLRNTKQRII